MGPLSIYNTQKNTLTPSTSSFTSTENPRIPFEMAHLQPRDNALSRTSEAAKRVLVQPLFSYPNSVTSELNTIFNLRITELQTFVSQIVSTNWVTDHHYMILQKYQKTFANLVTDVNQAKTDRLITEEEREKAESLLREANKFANRSAKIVGGLLAYQDAAENLHLAMEDFTEISYDSDEGYGDPLLGMPAMDRMINQFKELLHSTNNFSYIQDRYIDDLKAMELVLEPFCKELDRKINYECSILVPLLSDSRHSNDAFVQLKVLHKQISFMNGILQKMRPKINECRERWSLLSANRDTTASSYLQTINKHLNELDGRLKKFHQIIGRELNKTRLTARTDNIIYGKRTWKSLVKNRPEAHQGFFGKLFSYLNPNNYLSKIGPISPQKKAALILAVLGGHFIHLHYHLLQRAANMRSQADHLQKLARASIPPEIREQVDTEIAVIATALTYKFPFMSKDPTLIAKLTKRTPEATEFLSKAVERCGSNAPSPSVIKQLMQDYENIRLSSYLSPHKQLNLSDWFNTFTCSQDPQKENQSVKGSSSAELNVPIERAQIKSSLTDEMFRQAINDIPPENTSYVLFTEWENKIINKNHPFQASEEDLKNVFSRLLISEKLNLFKGFTRLGFTHKIFDKFVKIAIMNSLMSQSDWSNLIKELTNKSFRYQLHLAELFMDLVPNISYLKSLLKLKDNNGRSAVFWFTQAGRKASVEKLLKLGVDINSVDNKGITCTSLAISIEDIDILDLFINAKADLNKYDLQRGGKPPLIHALCNSKILEKLIQNKVNLSLDLELFRESWGSGILHQTVYDNCFESTKLLLRAGVPVEEMNALGRTPLYYAVLRGHKNITPLLIEFGADPFRHDYNLGNYYVLAKAYGRKEIQRLFDEINPNLKKDANEYYKYKGFAHILNLEGEYTSTITRKKISLTGFPDRFFFQNKIVKSIKRLGDRLTHLSINTRNAIIDAFEKSGSRAYSPADMLTDFKSGRPVIIHTGWVEHAITVVIFESNFIICNGVQAGLSSPFLGYKINPNRINKELITNLFSLKNEDLENFQNFVAPNGPLFTQLGCLDNASDCLNPYFENIKGAYERRSLQLVRNCAWHSLKMTLYGLIKVLTFAEKTKDPKTLPSEVLIDLGLKVEHGFRRVETDLQIHELIVIENMPKGSLNRRNMIKKIKKRNTDFPGDYSKEFLREFSKIAVSEGITL